MKILISERQIKRLVKEQIDNTYFETFSSAVQHAREKVEAKGFVIDEEDWWHEVNVGKGRPKEGDTTRMTLGLVKDGKQQRKALQIQVYNRGNNIKHNFELNYYVA